MGQPAPAPAEASRAPAGLDGTEIEQITLLQLTSGGLGPRAAATEKAYRLSAGSDRPRPRRLGRRLSPPPANSGCPSPKAVGPPASSKSLVAGAVAPNWNFPLSRLDCGRLQGSDVGESEKDLGAVLAQLSGVATCVCWAAEIEAGPGGPGATKSPAGCFPSCSTGCRSRAGASALARMQAFRHKFAAPLLRAED